MRFFSKWMISVILLFIFLSSNNYCISIFAESLVCRLEGINLGNAADNSQLNAANKYALQVIGKETTPDINEAKIYVTRLGLKDGLYYYYVSNFVSKNANYPTKIFTSEELDLGLISLNIIYTDEPSSAESLTLKDAHKKNIKFYIDQHVFDSQGKLPFDIDGAQKIYFVDIAGNSKPLIRINPTRGPPYYIVECSPGKFIRVTSSGNDCAFFKFLRIFDYKKNDVHLLSFYSDSAYDSAIKDASQVSSLVKNRLVPNSFTKEGIKSLFQNNPNDVFIALAHTNRDDFVLKDSDGNELSISIKELEDIAGEFGCDIIFIGCKTAQSGVSIGTDKKFNSIMALEKLIAAHDKAQNYDEFFNMLIGDDTFGLVFTCDALYYTARQRNIDIHLYDQKPVFTDIIDESTYSSRIYAALNEIEVSTTSPEEDTTVSPNPNSISRQSLIAILAASVLGFVFVFFGIKKFTKA